MMALADYGLKDICYDINENGKIVPNGKYDTTNCPHAGLNQAVPYVPLPDLSRTPITSLKRLTISWLTRRALPTTCSMPCSTPRWAT